MAQAEDSPTQSPSQDLSTSTYRMARRVWATTLIRGALFLVVGLVMFLWPGVAVSLITWLLVILMVIQIGLLAVEGTQRLGDDETAGAIVRYALAVVALAIVIALLVWPTATIKVVLILVGIWALISGAISAVGAVRNSQARKPAWDWEFAVACLWIVFGLMVIIKPLNDVGAVVAGLSVYLTVTGVVLLVAAWSVTVHRKDAAAARAAGAAAGGSGPAGASGPSGPGQVTGAGHGLGDLPTAPTPVVGDRPGPRRG